MLAGLAERAPAVTPVPVAAILRVGLAPFDVIATLPFTAPAAAGENFTVNDVLCPALRVKGRFSPVIVIPAPVADAAEIVTLVPPELVRVSVNDLLFPTTTLPKLKLA